MGAGAGYYTFNLAAGPSSTTTAPEAHALYFEDAIHPGDAAALGPILWQDQDLGTGTGGTLPLNTVLWTVVGHYGGTTDANWSNGTGFYTDDHLDATVNPGGSSVTAGTDGAQTAAYGGTYTSGPSSGWAMTPGGSHPDAYSLEAHLYYTSGGHLFVRRWYSVKWQQTSDQSYDLTPALPAGTFNISNVITYYFYPRVVAGWTWNAASDVTDQRIMDVVFSPAYGSTDIDSHSTSGSNYYDYGWVVQYQSITLAGALVGSPLTAFVTSGGEFAYGALVSGAVPYTLKTSPYTSTTTGDGYNHVRVTIIASKVNPDGSLTYTESSLYVWKTTQDVAIPITTGTGGGGGSSGGGLYPAMGMHEDAHRRPVAVTAGASVTFLSSKDGGHTFDPYPAVAAAAKSASVWVDPRTNTPRILWDDGAGNIHVAKASKDGEQSDWA